MIWKLALLASGIGLAYWALITWELQRLVPGSCCARHEGEFPFHAGRERRRAVDLYLDLATFAVTMVFVRRLARHNKATAPAKDYSCLESSTESLSSPGLLRPHSDDDG